MVSLAHVHCVLLEATDRYTLRGGEPETWEPRFTFHGFRYVEVNDWPGPLNLQDLSAVVLHSDLERTGWFESSDALLNQLHENVIWGMRGNFLDVPTDCPQRDERLGWTGDLQVFSRTASFLYDVSGLLQSWLKDLAVEQQSRRYCPAGDPQCYAGHRVWQRLSSMLQRLFPGAIRTVWRYRYSIRPV
jgi:alpha-L-rhamnosidase